MEKPNKLEEVEKYLAETQKAAKLGYWKFDIASNSVVWSDELFRIFEIEKSSFDGMHESFLDRVHPEDRELLLKKNLHVKETGEGCDFEYRICSREGKVKYIREIGYAKRDAYGAVAEIFGTAQDITDIKLANEALVECELKWRSLTENIPDYVSVHDSEGRFLYLNRSAEGFSEKDIIGRRATDYISPESREAWTRGFKECLALGETRTLRYSGYGDKGSERKFENYFIPVRRGETTTDVIAVFKDITDRERAEEMINSRLRENEILLKEVHHRVKNHISTILSMLNIQAEMSTNEDSRIILRDVISRLMGINLMYEKLLLEDSFREISVKLYLEDLIATIAEIFRGKGKIRVNSSIEDFILGVKMVFPIGIIVNEAITNSFKYAFKNRESGLIDVSVSRDENGIVVKVQDDGEGFPENFDVERSPGFGLMMAKVLVQQYDGSMSVENDGGARIVFSLKA